MEAMLDKLVACFVDKITLAAIPHLVDEVADQRELAAIAAMQRDELAMKVDELQEEVDSQRELAAIAASQREETIERANDFTESATKSIAELQGQLDNAVSAVAGLNEALCVAQAQTAEAREIAEGLCEQGSCTPAPAAMPWNTGAAA